MSGLNYWRYMMSNVRNLRAYQNSGKEVQERSSGDRWSGNEKLLQEKSQTTLLLSN